MRARKTPELPARLEGTRRRFERWRRSRQGRSPIPKPLWASAVKAARKYGLHRTAQTLRLDYYSLKKRVQAAASPSGPGAEAVAARGVSAGVAAALGVPGGEAGATFFELAPPAASPATSRAPACSPECILELEDSHGAKMRVHLKGSVAPDLAALSRSFWSVGG